MIDEIRDATLSREVQTTITIVVGVVIVIVCTATLVIMQGEVRDVRMDYDHVARNYNAVIRDVGEFRRDISARLARIEQLVQLRDSLSRESNLWRDRQLLPQAE